MKGLLDTHSFIWCDADPSKLSAKAASFIKDPGNTILLSVASVWEMVIKVPSGKLKLHAPLANVLAAQQANGIQILSVTLEHVLAVGNLGTAHKDPFDRLLAAQANVEGAVLVSADPIFAQYTVQVLW